MKNIPTGAWVCIAVSIFCVLGGFVYLAAKGSDVTEFRSFINTLLNFVGPLISGGALVYASQAAKQTNGGLDKRIKDGARAAIDEHQNDEEEKV